MWYQTLNLHAKAFPAGVTPKTYQLRSENVSESVLKRVHSYFMKNILLFYLIKIFYHYRISILVVLPALSYKVLLHCIGHYLDIFSCFDEELSVYDLEQMFRNS